MLEWLVEEVEEAEQAGGFAEGQGEADAQPVAASLRRRNLPSWRGVAAATAALRSAAPLV
ncbi:MAG: hypothetical protein N3B14_00285 [Thermoleophilia bacterium]|nr:hypothetical protein [Thermoleophilia bacterium]